MTAPPLPQDLLVKPYRVSVRHFDPHVYHAASHGKARSRAWNRYTAAGHDCPFSEFMKISRVTRCEAPENYGQPILVEGKRAYLIPGMDSHHHYVQFVYPNSEVILNSHPNDVQPFAQPSTPEPECSP